MSGMTIRDVENVDSERKKSVMNDSVCYTIEQRAVDYEITALQFSFS
jgi:hypothetical protein